MNFPVSLIAVLSLLLGGSASGIAKDAPAYPAAAIPEALKKNAHAIIRYNNTRLDIKELNDVNYTRKYAVTVLDEAGKKYAMLREGYNLQIRINKIKGRLLDAEGNELRSLKEKDITDRSTFGQSFVYHSDSRGKYYDFQQTTYPYTVEYEIEERYKTTFFLPDWSPQPDNDCAVEQAEFILTYPTDLTINCQEFLMPSGLMRTESGTGDRKSVTWKTGQIPAYERQPASKAGNYEDPTVVVNSERFELLDHKGDMKSWQSFGAFMYRLNEGRDVLPEDKKAVIRSLIAGETDTYAKIQKLYAYMQQNTRYVANEYGIAGWQTFDAESVAKNGYGDCKGLTNYLKAMLKAAGINAYAVLINAGQNHYKLDEAHPANVFNHMILCVPQPGDTVWVECTSQEMPAGYLGSFTQGRKALLVTENGGYVCTTPVYGKDKNYLHRSATLQLNSQSGQQTIKLRCRYSGPMQDDLNTMIRTQSEEKIRELVNRKFAFPSYSVTSYKYGHTGKPLLPEIEEQVEAQVGGIISSTRKRSFVNMAWMKNPMPEIFQTIPRTAPFVLKESFRISDTITVELPADMEVETLPRTVDFKYPFAEYHIRLEKADHKLSLIRTYEQNEGVYDPGDFEKYQELYRTINTEKENLNIVLLNKTS